LRLKLVSGGDLLWLVDPGCGRQLGWSGRLADEPLGVSLVGRVEHIDPGGVQLCGVAVVEGGRGHQPDPGMTMGVVVPVDEHSAMSAGVVDVVKPGGELGPVLQGLEVRLRVRVVAGGVRPAVRLRDAEIREQERDRFGALRCAAIGVEGQDLGGDLLLLGGLLDQRLGQLGVLAVLDRPADDVAAVLFPDPLCGRRLQRSTMTGANGSVVAFSAT
jgi:hypothetical protein